eukprot:CAMPEP_0176184386 /NCGR_PEP_ID=MMETSP0121_2-20121125/789_1 /TAXON_ID=160619 /ORGANISM="Kryptoperidinium foliaceum, Strain CCMP 1326" /LENGTH=43 /DNA_ID= /DNA_START= /DNA_END= /DNA_ORIENTATION=
MASAWLANPPRSFLRALRMRNRRATQGLNQMQEIVRKSVDEAL